MEKRFTPDNIQELKENQIFVFGSNMNGNHAGGAARLAVEKFGAIMGRAEGIQGQSYAIPTLDENMEKVAEEDLINYLANLRHFANEHPEKEFLLTAIGTGIAGFDTNYMAYMVLRANLPGNVTIPEEFSKIRGFKGFNSDMTCRGFKYEEGKDYEEQGYISACNKGFHFCLYPLDVFGYYPPAYIGMNKFHEVEGSGEMDVDTDDTKIACSKIHIGAELSIKSIVDAAIKFTFSKCKWVEEKIATGNRGAASSTGNQGAASATGDQGAASSTGNQGAASSTGYQGAASSTGYQGAASSTGDQGAASSTGYQGAASATGYRGAASATGNQGAASATGDQGAASATGNRGAASSTGNQGAASATGDQGAASSTGNQGAASSTGYQGAASATGYQGAASATGKESIALAAGKDCKAKGALGCWIVLAERGEWDGNTYPIVSVKAFKVDGKSVKADTFYTLVNGEAVEASQD
jgi:hypothetical protein